MYRIVYNGSDFESYSRLKDGLPENMTMHFIASRKECLEYFRHHANIDALVLSISNPEPEDLQHFQILSGQPEVPEIIVIGTNLSASQVVCLMRAGAYDCINGKPSANIFTLLLSNLFQDRESCETSNILLHGHSGAINQIRHKIKQYAELELPVLIYGETGSGKELVARSLHNYGHRKQRPFVALNCAAYNDELLSTELFGSCRGAFTGSVERKGLFEAAEDGSIFLDEINELSLLGQAKLLRVIEEKCVRHLGSNHIRAVNARVIAATNQNPQEMCEKNQFRSDLLYRLNILYIRVPPLRDHQEDIPQLVRLFLQHKDCPSRRIDSSAMKALMEYSWPGNVRELRAVVIKSSINASGHIIRIKDIVFD